MFMMLFSPQFSIFSNKTETLPVESRMNITALALAPNGQLMIAVNESQLLELISFQMNESMRFSDGEAHLISLRSGTVLHTFHFHRQVHAISFSPDGR
jgi:hypothetical protein